MAISGIPERMLLSASMRAAEISKGLLISLSINGEKKQVIESDAAHSSEIIKSHTGKHGSICFVVRRPG